MQNPNDQRLYKLALQRAEFRKSLYSYVIVNGFFWAIWWFTDGQKGNVGLPWPIWVMLGWGLGLLKQFYDAYQSNKAHRAEKEFERLKNRQ